MPYTLPENVRRLVETTLTDEEITSLIEESDAEVDKRLGSAVVTDPLVRKLSTLLTVKTIRGRDPRSVSVGEYSESSTLEDLEAEIDAITRLYRRPSVKATPDTATEPGRLTA